MNTQQLESFVQVAETLNFARAAEALNITQSAVSRQIHALEEELDTKLFHRSTRTVSLTPSGITFLTDAKEILSKLDMAAQKLKKHSTSAVQVISIGCAKDTVLAPLTPLLQACREQLPEIHPFLRVLPSRMIMNLFAHNELDLVFGFQGNFPIPKHTVYKELAQIPICYAVPAAHPLASAQCLEEKELLTEHFAICNSYEIPSTISNIQNSLAHQLPPNSLYFCEDLQALRALIKAGYGIGILPQTFFTEPDITYIPMSQKLTLSYGIFYKSNPNNPILKKFITLLKTWE